MKKICRYFFGWTEIGVGILQAIAVIRHLRNEPPTTDHGVLFAAGALSFFLGFGLLLEKRIAILALIFFSSGILFLKLILLSGLGNLPPASQILFSKSIENPISLGYHLALLVFLFTLMTKEPE